MPSKKLIAAREAHEKWLTKNGVSREQLVAKRVKVKISSFPDYSVKENLPLSNKFDKTPGKNTMMEKRFREAPSVRAEIEKKAQRLAPAYSKGAVQFLSDGDNPHYIGKKI